jgi:hypothetical protein
MKKINYPLYVPGQKLEEGEYLLKLMNVNNEYNVGFLTLFNKNGSIPVNFTNWGNGYRAKIDLPIYVFKEEFNSGWKLESWRIGESQSWARLFHPEGFLVEIHLQNFLETVKTGDLIKGELQGKYKWEYSKLIKEK